ncbi:hypothetical protein TUBRATIS_009500 [Tubulinosema ratisbonensis]|uniref:Uncharacterized protein n=1 Tax=Tubulinosema ratisbonensis TaxID=291195 RepID=A0A437AN00_9MICR|nr:hypothetical protein TUBRATIS_009500 [Tubulinosema ratisbonensis]
MLGTSLQIFIFAFAGTAIFCIFMVRIYLRILETKKYAQGYDVRGIKAYNRQSSALNTCIQSLASFDDLIDYLKKSQLKENSITKLIYKFIEQIKKNGFPVQNKMFYERIMEYFHEKKIFFEDNSSFSANLYIAIVNQLFKEEMEDRMLFFERLDELSYKEYCQIVDCSTIFELFGLGYFDKNYKITFKILTLAIKNIQHTINLLINQPNKDLQPRYLHHPKILIFSFNQTFFTKETFDLKTNLEIKFKSLYLLKSVGFITFGEKNKSFFRCVSRRNGFFYLFDDTYVSIENDSERFVSDGMINFVVYEKMLENCNLK